MKNKIGSTENSSPVVLLFARSLLVYVAFDSYTVNTEIHSCGLLVAHLGVQVIVSRHFGNDESHDVINIPGEHGRCIHEFHL
jgi:hypothetical protein